MTTSEQVISARPRSPRRERPPEVDDAALRPPWTAQRIALVGSTVVGLLGFLVSAWYVDLSPGAFVAGLQDMGRLLDRMLPPTLSAPVETIRLALETLFMAVLGTVLAVVLSLPVAFLSARNVTPIPWLYGPARALTVLCRSIPDLVFALIFVRVLGIGILPGILALGLHSIGMLGKLFADAIEEIDERPREAMASTGANWFQIMWGAVFPQILPSVIGTALYRLDINVRLSTVLGFVGAGGIGLMLRATLGSLRYKEALGVVLVIVVLIVAVELLASAMRQAIAGATSESRPGARERMRTHGLRPAGRGDSASPVGAAVRDVDGAKRRRSDLDFDPESLRPPWTRERRKLATYWVGLATLVVFAFAAVRVNPLEIPAAAPKLLGVLARFFPPDFTMLGGVLFTSMAETIAIGIAAAVIGVAVAVPLAFLAARTLAPSPWIYFPARLILVLWRAVPELVVAVLFVSAVGLGPFAGVLALIYGTIGFGAKLFADQLEDIDDGPREALRSAGSSRLQEIGGGVLPQFVPGLISTSSYLLDINIRSAVVLGIVGAGGVGFYLMQSMRVLEFPVTCAILILVFLVVYAIERLGGWLRRMII